MTQSTAWLRLTLLSDTTFGRGDGVAGLVDGEVQHDEYGLPYLNGKTLKGLLGAECAEILFALERSGCANLDQWQRAGEFLFGNPGSRVSDIGGMKVSHAQLPDDLRTMIASAFYQNQEDESSRAQKLKQMRVENLESLTALRRQTAMSGKSGAPLKNSLRTMRVILRETEFVSRLEFASDLVEHPKWLLAACVKSFRRAGTGRNRGRGRLKAVLYDQPLYGKDSVSPPAPVDWFAEFEQAVRATGVQEAQS